MADTSDEMDVDAVARTVFGEARNQGAQGMQAVANVIMNRVTKKTWYGENPYEVCHKHSQKGVHQFSCWNSNDPNCQLISDVDETDPLFAQCLNVALAAVGGSLEDITEGATHYKVVGTPASWAKGKTPCVTIKQHEFFNNID